jgi:hypothetical protein
METILQDSSRLGQLMMMILLYKKLILQKEIQLDSKKMKMIFFLLQKLIKITNDKIKK